MFTQTLSLALLASAGLVSATPTHVLLHKRQQGATGTTLEPNAIQSGSFVDGSVNGALKDGQSASATSQNNFINNCVGKTLTNGLQVQGGSCNGIRK
jgi:hypothetical protein